MSNASQSQAPCLSPVRSLHLCFGYVVLLPALLFLWDTEELSGPGVWCSAAEKKRGKKASEKTSALFDNQKQMFWVFWRRSNWYVVSPCAQLWGGKTKTASSPAPCWVQIKITVRRQEQLLRETGWHTEWWGSASHTSWHSISLKLVQLYSPWPCVYVCVCVCVCVWILRYLTWDFPFSATL